jgi:Na+:H+ antiporter
MLGTDELLLQMFAIFVWAKFGGEVFERLLLPAVLGEILIGIVLGPSATGLIVPSQTIFAIAQLGAIFLLFTVGLETSASDLIRVGRQSLGVAVAGMAVPFIFGFAFMMWRNGEAHEAVFVAAAMVATSVGITARVMQDLGVLQSRVAKIILGASVYDDIGGMILLAVVVGLVSAAGLRWIQLTVVTVEALAFSIFMIVIAPRLINRIGPSLERLQTHNAPLILSLALCLGLSVAATKIGMAAIIGAFFAGIAFADHAREWNLLHRVQGINDFLAPFFFFTIGTRFDIHVLHGNVLVSAIVIALLAVVSKAIGCGLPVLREGWQTAARVGVAMIPRGEVGLIVALVGVQMGMVSNDAYAIVIFMTGVTTLIAPPVLRLLFRREAVATEAPAVTYSTEAK